MTDHPNSAPDANAIPTPDPTSLTPEVDKTAPHSRPEAKPKARTSRRGALLGAGVAVAAAVGGAAAGRMTAPVTATPQPAAAMGPPRFAGQAVMVTGATSGIGEAAARAFAAEGANVWFCGRREALGRQVEASIRETGGTATYVQTDLRIEDQVKAFTDRMVSATGRIDAAFNNAGISIESPFAGISTADWDDVFDTNVRGAYLSMKYQLPIMAAAKRGSIVLTSSVQGRASRATGAVYSASKYAMIGLMQATALEYGPLGVRINAILPGTTDTPLVRRQAGGENLPEAAWQEGATAWAKTNVHGLQRMALADEIAVVAVDMCTTRYSYMNGASIPIDGGMSVAL